MPGLVGIEASIAANEEGATAWIDTKDFELVLPKVYREPIRLAAVMGTLEGRWQRDALFLEHGLLLGTARDHEAAVQFEIDIPFSKEASVPLEMRLAASVLDAPVAIRDAYVPYRMPATAYRGCNRHYRPGRLRAGCSYGTAGSNPTVTPVKPLQLAADLSGVTLRLPARLAGRTPDLKAGCALMTRELMRGLRRVNWQSSRSLIRQSGLHVGSDAIWLNLQTQSNGKPGEILSALEQMPALSAAYPVMRDLTVGGDEPTATNAQIRFDVRNVARHWM